MEGSTNFIKPEEYRLYVTNLPVELNEEGIKQIFDIYGNIIGLFYRPNATWAFVTYKTYREAEYALRDLHDKPPLYLKVSFGKQKTCGKTKEEKSENKKSTESYEHLTHNSPCSSEANIQTINRGKCVNAFSKERISSLFDPVSTDSDICDLYESIEPYSNRNALWTSGTVTVTHGKRHVSHGRGYTYYEIPDPHPRIEKLINQIHEKRSNGFYEHGQDVLKHRIGKCIYCDKSTDMKCKRCYAFYCSRECQIEHWPNHKIDCHQIPGLIKNTVSSSTISSKEDEPVSTLPQTQNTLRRPRQAALSTYAEVITNKNTNITETEISKQEDLQNNHQTNNAITPDSDLSTLSTCKDETKQIEKINKSNALKIEENLAFKRDTFLSTKMYTHVKIVYVEYREVYWVQKCESKKSIEKMNILLQTASKDRESRKKVEPIIGNVYAYKYENKWYRVRVTFLNPTKIRFIDYGNTIEITNDDFYEIDSISYPPFARKITLSNSAKGLLGILKVNDIIVVKAVMLTKNAIVVDVKTTKDNISSKPNSKPLYLSLKNVLDYMSENVHGFLDVQTIVSNNVYGVILIPEHLLEELKKIVNKLPVYCKSAKSIDKQNISMGQLVCAKNFNGDWLRACVISVKPLQFAMIDETKIMLAQEIVEYPSEFFNICKFGVICEVSTNNKLMVGDSYKFKVISRTDKINIQIIMDNENNIEAVLKPWEPKPDLSSTNLYKLKSGSEVCITAYHGLNKLYVRSLQTEDIEKYHQLMQQIAKCAQAVPYLKEPPVVGEMVLAQYTDENFYRAIVTKIVKDDIAISYVDFGNGENISLKKLKILPTELRLHPPCTTRVILKDIPSTVTVTKELSDYFACLTGREIPLICQFDGSSFEDGVSLTMANGESINAKIKQMLTPSWKKDDEKDKTVYTVADILPAKLGDGDEIRVIVLCTVHAGVKYIMCPLDFDLITNVYDVLPGLMNEYCEAADYYIPRNNELCLGLYDGNWYRGLCTDSTSRKDECQIFFLDYGNMEYVPHEDIRAMTKDFLTPATLSNICTVVNLAPKDEDGNINPCVLNRISELVNLNYKVLIKIIENPEQGFYTIELPEVRAKLIEEGLI